MGFRRLPLLVVWLAAWVPIAAYFWPEATWIRIDLASRGLVLVRLVKVEELGLGIFKYVDTASFAHRAIVFSGDRMVGYTFWPNGWYPFFVPASGKIDYDSQDNLTASTRMEDLALVYWKEQNRATAALVGAAVAIPCTAWLGLIAFGFWRTRCAESVSRGTPPQ